MTGHWWKAILFATTITAYGGFMWIMFAFVIHAHRRIVIMLDQGYYWKDAGAILRREKRKESGPKPKPGGAHRAPSAKQREQSGVQILSIEDHAARWEDPHGEDVIEALRSVPETDVLGEVPPTRDPTTPMHLDPADLPVTETMEVHHAPR